jgi:hypothetical protein
LHHQAIRFAKTISCLLLAVSGAAVLAQQTEEISPEAKALVEREQMRSSVEGVFEAMVNERNPLHPAVALQKLVALGPGAIPFLEAEYDAPETPWWPLACNAVALIGTPASTVSLRKAYAIAE